MAIKRGISGINLLPKDSFEFSTAGKVLKWITTAGRVMVVMTEFLVLLAFGSRFYFDKKLDDLNEVIVQKQAQIEAYSEVEAHIRKVLAKQTPIKVYQANGINFEGRINELSRILPTGTVIDSFSLGSSGLSISGKAQSEYGFAVMLGGFKKMQNISSINLKDSGFDQTTGGVKFSIQINFKDGQSS